MPYSIKLSKNCKDLLFDDYDEFCERGKPNTAVEDDMLCHSLTNAMVEGWVTSFSKDLIH